MMFTDRTEAGHALAADLADLTGRNPLVLALPRGGVPVAAAIAEALGADLDLLLVRKLGVPGREELAMGAISEGGIRVLNRGIIEHSRVTPEQFADVEEFETFELERRAALWRRTDMIPRAGRLALIVDDGVATGATAEAACRVAEAAGMAGIVLAAPVAPPEAAGRIRALGVDLRCRVDDRFSSVGAAYSDFHQLSDDEVAQYLQ